MSDNEVDEEVAVNPDEFGIAHRGDPTNPEALIVNIPIREPAIRGQRGMDEAYGRMRRLEAIVITMIKGRMIKEQKVKEVNGVIKPGVIGPDGRPMTVA